MKKVLILLSIVTAFVTADQTAITDNGVEVLLKEDNTWQAIDSISNQISSFATTEDSQIVFLKDDGTWEYWESIDAVSGATRKDDVDIVPYYKLKKKPKPIKIPTPEYPEEARKNGIEGIVFVRILLDTNGIAGDVKILKSSGEELLDKSALEAAKQVEFTPSEHWGKPARVRITLPIRFSLADKSKLD